MIRTILAATDLEDGPDRALRSGAALARQLGARLIAVHCTGGAADEAEPGLRVRLAELPVEAEARIAQGDDAGSLLEEARAVDADLIVLGPHRHGLLADLFGTSMVERLIKGSRRLILVAGPQATEHYDRIVLATDFSDGSLAAAKAALNLFPNAQLSLVHVFHVPFEGFLRSESIAADLRAEAEERLAAFRGELGAAVVDARVEEGETQFVLHEAIRRAGAHLFVFGSDSGGGTFTHPFGRIARAFFESPPCDVLAVQEG